MGTTTILDRLRFPESTRWHDGRLWVCNWLASEVLAVDPADGNAEVVARVPVRIPFCIDWLPDGRLLVTGGGSARCSFRRATERWSGTRISPVS